MSDANPQNPSADENPTNAIIPLGQPMTQPPAADPSRPITNLDTRRFPQEAPSAEAPATVQFSNMPTAPRGLPARLEFHVREGGRVLTTPLISPLIIGRRSSSLPVDIDLSEVKAQDMGVSRNHVKIEVVEGYLKVADMDTINGTTLNRSVMKANQLYPLHDGDELKLGRIHLKVVFVYNK
jgi:hypothetical protein